MLGVECLSQISSLFSSDVRVRASLATRLLQFLELLVRDDELRVALRTHFDFLASLSTFLQRHDSAGSPPSKDEPTIRCVSLLQRFTFGLDTRDESHRHLEFLVSLLVSVLLNSEGDGESAADPTLLLPSLALLANLSKNNPFVQSLVRNHVNKKAFYKRLIACLARKDDTAVVICAKSVFASLYLNNNNKNMGGASLMTQSSDGSAGGCYNDRLAEKLFSQSNIRQTFQLVLNCMQKASSSVTSESTSSSLFAQSYGVDLLYTLLKVPAYANCFLAYDHRDAFCRGFFDLLVHVHSRRKTLKDAGFNILLRFLELIHLLSEFDELKTTLASASMAAPLPSSGGEATPPFIATLIAIVESGPKLMTRSALAAAAAAVNVLERMQVVHASSSGASALFVEKIIPACALVLGVLSEHRPLNGLSGTTQSTVAVSPAAVSGISSNAPFAPSSTASKKAETPVESLLVLAASVYRLLAAVIHLRDAVSAFKGGLDFDVPVATIETLIRHHNVGGNGDVRSSAATIPWQEAAIDVVLQALRFLAVARKVQGG